MSDYFKNCYSARPLDGCVSVNEEDVSCPLDQVSLDSLCPLNSVTGLREQPLSRLLDPTCSDSEKSVLLSTLQKVDYPIQNVDDETKMMFVKLRSLQTPSELKSFSSAIRSWLDDHSSDTTVDNPPADNSPASTEDAN